MTNHQSKGVRGTGFYESSKWKKVRDDIRLRDAMTCQSCGQAIYGRSIVDHIVPVTLSTADDWNIAYNPKNLQLLCQACHNDKTASQNFDHAKSLW